MFMAVERKSHVIPLRRAFSKPSSVKRPNSMIRIIERFMKKHFRKMPKDIIIAPEVNEKIWENSKNRLPRRLDVDVVEHENRAYVFLRGSKEAEKVGLKKDKKEAKPAAKKEAGKDAEPKEEGKSETVKKMEKPSTAAESKAAAKTASQKHQKWSE